MILLLVSYDPESLNSRTRLFQEAGHLVVPASSLQQALKDVRSGDFDALVLGVTVPNEDRAEIVRAAHGAQHAAKIICVDDPERPITPFTSLRVAPKDP